MKFGAENYVYSKVHQFSNSVLEFFHNQLKSNQSETTFSKIFSLIYFFIVSNLCNEKLLSCYQIVEYPNFSTKIGRVHN